MDIPAHRRHHLAAVNHGYCRGHSLRGTHPRRQLGGQRCGLGGCCCDDLGYSARTGCCSNHDHYDDYDAAADHHNNDYNDHDNDVEHDDDCNALGTSNHDDCRSFGYHDFGAGFHHVD